MISEFSSFIEFFAAVYVTMAINNEFCKKFWTPGYYKEIDLFMKEKSLYSSSKTNNRISTEIHNNYSRVQGHAQKKGFLMLSYCILLLAYIGFETNSYNPPFVSIYYLSLALFVMILLPNVFLKTWRTTLIYLLFLILIYILLSFYNVRILRNNLLFYYGDLYKKHFVMFMILFPVIYQLLLYWAYSSVYKGYLKNKVTREIDIYNEAIVGVKTKNKNKIEKSYLAVFVNSIFESDDKEDNTITSFNDLFYKKLVKAASPSLINLFISYIIYKCHFLKEKINKKGNKNKEVNSQNIMNSLAIYSKKNAIPLDFSEEYRDFLLWKKSSNRIKASIANYCKIHNINEKDMLAWIRVNKPSNHKKMQKRVYSNN